MASGDDRLRNASASTAPRPTSRRPPSALPIHRAIGALSRRPAAAAFESKQLRRVGQPPTSSTGPIARGSVHSRAGRPTPSQVWTPCWRALAQRAAPQETLSQQPRRARAAQGPLPGHRKQRRRRAPKMPSTNLRNRWKEKHYISLRRCFRASGRAPTRRCLLCARPALGAL